MEIERERRLKASGFSSAPSHFAAPPSHIPSLDRILYQQCPPHYTRGPGTRPATYLLIHSNQSCPPGAIPPTVEVQNPRKNRRSARSSICPAAPPPTLFSLKELELKCSDDECALLPWGFMNFCEERAETLRKITLSGVMMSARPVWTWDWFIETLAVRIKLEEARLDRLKISQSGDFCEDSELRRWEGLLRVDTIDSNV